MLERPIHKCTCRMSEEFALTLREVEREEARVPDLNCPIHGGTEALREVIGRSVDVAYRRGLVIGRGEAIDAALEIILASPSRGHNTSGAMLRSLLTRVEALRGE